MVFCLLTCKNIYFVFCLFMLFPFNSTHRLTHDQVWYGNDDSLTWFYSFRICFHENHFASVRKIICIKKENRWAAWKSILSHSQASAKQTMWLREAKRSANRVPKCDRCFWWFGTDIVEDLSEKKLLFFTFGNIFYFWCKLKNVCLLSEGFPCDTHFISSPECAMLHASFKDFYWREVCPCTLPSF